MENDDDLVDPLDRLLAEDIPPAMPPGPGGLFAPAPIQPEPIPEATPETMICLRGPCVHYVEIQTRFQAGNSKGTLDAVPVQKNRFCNVMAASEIDLTDEIVMDCNKWDPQGEFDVPVTVLRVRRKDWTDKNGG